jgi:hypothetical protein
MGNKVGYFGNICDVAAALSSNAEFESGPFHFFEQKCFRSCFSCLSGSHKPCRATAYYDYF